eukprot:scaffold12065_cov80-Skeletonema_marinoi.AAC.1
MEDATDGVLRALKSKRCRRDSQCEDDEECIDRECVTKSKNSRKGSRASRRGRCNTTMKVVAVLTDPGDERRCAKRLRSNNSITRFLDRNFHPKRMHDFETARVGD